VDKESLVARVAALTEDLQPARGSTAEELRLARAALASALAREQVGAESAPAVVGGGTLAAGTFAARTVAERAGLAALVEDALQQLPAEDAGFRVYRRELPVLTTQHPASLPAWAAGQAIERTFGPFRDPLGRDFWFDIFRIVRQASLVRSPGAAPFLTLPLPGIAFSGDRFTLGPGSLWFASVLLAPDAPVGGYTGLRIKGGQLTLSHAVTATGTEIVVPPGITCTVDIELDPPVAATGVGA
jgi:hypothetical protein